MMPRRTRTTELDYGAGYALSATRGSGQGGGPCTMLGNGAGDGNMYLTDDYLVCRSWLPGFASDLPTDADAIVQRINAIC